MLAVKAVSSQEHLRASPCFATLGLDRRLTAKGGSYNEVRPNLLHVTDYGIGLCLQLLDIVESGLGYKI